MMLTLTGPLLAADTLPGIVPAWSLLIPAVILLLGALGCLLLGRLLPSRNFCGELSLLAIVTAGGLSADCRPMATWLANALSLQTHAFSTTASAPVAADPLSWLLQSFLLVLGALMVLGLLDSPLPPRRIAWRYGLLLIALAAGLVLVVANDLLVMQLALALLDVSLFLSLWIEPDYPGMPETVLKFAYSRLLAGVLIFIGSGILLMLCGTTNITLAREILTASYQPESVLMAIGQISWLGFWAVGFLFVGLSIPCGYAPGHLAFGDVCEGASYWHQGQLSTIPKVAALAVLVRLPIQSSESLAQWGVLLAPVLAAFTCLAGVILAWREQRIRRILAWTTVSQTGLVLVAYGVGCSDRLYPEQSLELTASGLPGISAAYFTLFSLLLATLGLCLTLSHLSSERRKIDYVEDLNGLIRRHRLAALTTTVCLLSLAGCPPLPGFWSRIVVLVAVWNAHTVSPTTMFLEPNFALVGSVMIALVATLLLVAIYLRLLSAVLFAPPIGQLAPRTGQSSMAAAVFAAAILCGIGLLPGPIVGYMSRGIDRHAVTAEPPAAGQTDGSHHGKTQAIGQPGYVGAFHGDPRLRP